ncbi:MAG TPA: isocitrate lyase/phosphoenolpyruvate mutase family protein [Terriglobia bacterium]|nr:isocitrate lyase/phosphoenolpyruvate mutase family protein [Terriglobia bacterium]
MNNVLSLQKKALLFASLHRGPRILILANAWDAASARIFEAAGCPAIATTSAGVAFSLGRRDGEQLSRDEMLEVVRRVTSSVSIPVSADMESGYGDTPEAVAGTVRAVMDAGAVGMNLEDRSPAENNALFDVSIQVEKIKAVREAAASAGVDFVLNARTDVFLRGVGEPASRLDHAIRRANAFREAGADCLFVPGVTDRETIATLAREIHGPLNILGMAGAPPVAELEKLGVARISVGSGPMRATMALTRRIARELLDSGTYTAITESTIPGAELNQLFQTANEKR